MQHLLLKKAGLIASLMLLSVIFSGAYAYDLVVAKDGSGTHTTVQAAINAVPANLTAAYTIYIKNGKYKEKITVPSNKPFIQLIGESVANTILTWDDGSGTPAAGGGTVGTQGSASFSINANDFSAMNITFENSYGEGPAGGQNQAVAVLVNADRSAFKNCRFLGNQDTLYAKGSSTPRHYFKNCYIDGTVDFIFGSSVAVFDSCVIYAKTRAAAGSSYITAANTPTGQSFGYVFRDNQFPANRGVTTYFLARPWPSPSVIGTQQKTVLLNAILSSSIKPEGWSVWDANTDVSRLYYGEYQSRYFNGTAVDISQRVPWSYQLSSTDAAGYTLANMFANTVGGGFWDPCTVAAGFCDGASRDIAIANFKGTKGASLSTFNWNVSWAFNQLKMELYRSVDNVAFTKIDEVIAPTDTSFNFSLTDPIPPSGSIYYYYISASKAGYASQVTDTVSISSAPTITTTGTLNLFNQTVGSFSPTQSYQLSGTDLTAGIVVTPPVNYEVSANGGTNWYTNAAPLTVAPVSGTVSSTGILVRLNASVAGSYPGNIVHSSTGALPVNVAVTGTSINAPLINSTNIQGWAFASNDLDSAAIRSPYVVATTPTFKNLHLSNGTTLANIPAYSATYGNAFGASANGDGTWTTAVGGPGGNLNRNHYKEFKINATAGALIRIDSIILNAAFYNTSSNTKLAIVYSKTGFTTNDSSDITGGTGPGNTSVTGSFATPIPLANQTGGPANNYRLAIAGTTGVTINAGGTLTIRLYLSCGSTGTPRYAMLKNVLVKGEASGSLPVNLLSFQANISSQVVNLHWRTTSEINTQEFRVERSGDGMSYSTIGTVKANNTTATSNYQLQDLLPLKGNNYYRLKTIDIGGAFSYSKVVAVSNTVKAKFSIYTNPVADKLLLTYTSAKPGAVFTVVTLDGKLMLTAKASVASAQTTVDVRNLKSGAYLVVFYNGDEKSTNTFIKR